MMFCLILILIAKLCHYFFAFITYSRDLNGIGRTFLGLNQETWVLLAIQNNRRIEALLLSVLLIIWKWINIVFVKFNDVVFTLKNYAGHFGGIESQQFET